jgi:2-polyprenyl-3-methyl-5-hydroxy-6-metoxy-1,4-benzoquinol methylase
MAWIDAARRHPKWVLKETAYRLRLRSYRPDSGANWDAHYRANSATDGFATDHLMTLGKYSIVVGYLRYFAPDAEILDVGCGPGSLRRYLCEGSFARYVGVDHSPHAIELASTAFPDDKTTFVLADDVPDDAGTFGAVALLDVLYHVDRPEETIDRIRQFVRPGGVIVTSHWVHPGEWMLLKMLDERFERLDMVFLENPNDRERSPFGHRVTCHALR